MLTVEVRVIRPVGSNDGVYRTPISRPTTPNEFSTATTPFGSGRSWDTTGRSLRRGPGCTGADGGMLAETNRGRIVGRTTERGATGTVPAGVRSPTVPRPAVDAGRTAEFATEYRRPGGGHQTFIPDGSIRTWRDS